jgi:hypothetical protein
MTGRIIKRVLLNKGQNILYVNLPKSTTIKVGDYVEVTLVPEIKKDA